MKYEYEYGDTTYKAFQVIKRYEKKLNRLLKNEEIRNICQQVGADTEKVKRNLSVYFPNRLKGATN